MKNSKIIIVSCTQKNEDEFKETPLGKSIEKHHKLNNIFDSIVFTENKKGMSECYNKGIKEILNNKILSPDDKFDDVIAVFVHDDVYLTDCFLKEKLEEAMETYDVVGVAGSSNFSLGRERVAWHISPRETWSGSVEHPYENGVDNNQTYWTYFGPVPKQCAVIDGVIICVNLKKIVDNDVRFDENFLFHGYDTSFCLRCLKKNLKIGTTNIHLTHLSHGDSFNSEEYYNVEKLLRDKYGKKIGIIKNNNV